MNENPINIVTKELCQPGDALWRNRVITGDALAHMSLIPDGSIDLILTDPPYGLGKDYGNNSDKLEEQDYLAWTQEWIVSALPKLKPNGSLYIFLTWRFSPEIFVMLKQHLTMLNEIIWDRRVPSMGGGIRRYSSVHDTVGFFVQGRDYYFDLDAILIPYDAVTKKARSRKIFECSKLLELGYNPKDVWSVSRLHRECPERAEHPTQKPLEIIERMIKASCPPGGVVFDPFMGSGTTAVAAKRCGRDFAGFELNPEYCQVITSRLEALALSGFPDINAGSPGVGNVKIRVRKPAKPIKLSKASKATKSVKSSALAGSAGVSPALVKTVRQSSKAIHQPVPVRSRAAAEKKCVAVLSQELTPELTSDLSAGTGTDLVSE